MGRQPAFRGRGRGDILLCQGLAHPHSVSFEGEGKDGEYECRIPSAQISLKHLANVIIQDDLSSLIANVTMELILGSSMRSRTFFERPTRPPTPRCHREQAIKRPRPRERRDGVVVSFRSSFLYSISSSPPRIVGHETRPFHYDLGFCSGREAERLRDYAFYPHATSYTNVSYLAA